VDVPLRRLRHGDADLRARLSRGPRLPGERFIATDVLWGAALAWMPMFKRVPD
jgi:glutathione S-transferase